MTSTDRATPPASAHAQVANEPSLPEACRALLSLIRREAPHLSGKVLGDAEAALAHQGERQAEPVEVPPDLEVWNGDRKVTIYPDCVLRVWGVNIDTEMSDEPRSQQAVQDALAWLYATPEAPAPASAVTEALHAARSFIRNGVKLGYIRMPDADCPDPAHQTLPKIEAALAALSTRQADGAKPGAAVALTKEEPQRFSPEYLEHLANLADPDQLWRLPGFERLALPEDRMQQLDAGVNLRRYAQHRRRLLALIGTSKSLLLTPLSPNGTFVRVVETPDEDK